MAHFACAPRSWCNVCPLRLHFDGVRDYTPVFVSLAAPQRFRGRSPAIPHFVPALPRYKLNLGRLVAETPFTHLSPFRRVAAHKDIIIRASNVTRGGLMRADPQHPCAVKLALNHICDVVALNLLPRAMQLI